MLASWNLRLFLALNAPDDANPVVMTLAKALAAWTLVPVLTILVALWIWGAPRRRGAPPAVVALALIAMILNGIIKLVYVHSRPFVLGMDHTLVPHTADGGFPSDHAMFLLTLGLGLIAIGAIGLATAWACLYFGANTSIAILGSHAAALAAALLARVALARIEKFLRSAVEELYLAILQILRLPAALYPRHHSGDVWS